MDCGDGPTVCGSALRSCSHSLYNEIGHRCPQPLQQLPTGRVSDPAGTVGQSTVEHEDELSLRGGGRKGHIHMTGWFMRFSRTIPIFATWHEAYVGSVAVGVALRHFTP